LFAAAALQQVMVPFLDFLGVRGSWVADHMWAIIYVALYGCDKLWRIMKSQKASAE